ncbi:unnamed protein product [Ceratitis capitata]|uniref:(Mediterranean fruit fly) hypothetical protein n=1 Tax=Ceratitis capitata TaxID=7213 RepID=A0A811UX55_CERCA|nr:unnamed protein product [Ceratitis capitata]
MQHKSDSVLVIAQCFCLMPVRGILAATPKDYRSVGNAFAHGIAYCTYWQPSPTPPNHKYGQPLIFHANILLASFGFLRLAAKWPQLMRKWQRVERQLPPHQSWRDREALSVRVHKVTFVLITLSLSKLPLMSGDVK